MNESINARAANPSAEATMTNSLTSDGQWAQWQESGARHDERVARNMRILAGTALTIGAVWALMAL